MSDRLAAYWALTKPGITGLVMLTAGAGFWMAARDAMDIALLAYTLIGTGFVVAGTNALNQWWERDADARMHRTRRRPLPAGALSPEAALVFAIAVSAAGLLCLATLTNASTTLLAAVSLALYILAYTPLKRRTSWALFVGAVPGALPILGGWTAGGGELSWGGLVLFAILFLWQIPHFLALGWLYREDYRRGGFAMLSRDDHDGHATGRQAVVFAAAVLPVSLLPALLGLAGSLYLLGAVVLGAVLVGYSAGLLRAPTPLAARRLFSASVVYLPLLLLLLTIR